MPQFLRFGSYSISILHYSLYHWDRREVVFVRPVRAYQNWLAHYYVYKKDRERMNKIWQQRIVRDKNYIFKYGKQHEKNFIKLNLFLDRALPRLGSLKASAVSVLFKNYFRLLQYSEAIGDINHEVDDILTHRISEPLRCILTSRHCDNRFTEYLIGLTTPSQILPTQEEELEFLMLVEKMKGSNDKNLYEALQQHLQKYAWIPVWYDNTPWTFQDLEKRFRAEVVNGDSKERIMRLQQAPKKNAMQAEDIIHELGLKGRLLDDIKALCHFTFIRTKIDLHTSYVVHKARPLYECIAKLLGVTFNDLKFLTPQEVIHGLQGVISGKKLLELIQPRKVFAVQIFNKARQTILVGEKAHAFMRKMHARMAQEPSYVEDIKELKGVGASLGLARGRARVIGSISELSTMQEGEVLIVPSTSVDFVGAMKKSVAVVTEVGGITSHAAIVSRELGKPCVVNTLTATKVFKNGDMVEVDAQQGIVRRI